MEGDDPVGVAANDESTDESDPSDKSPVNDSSWAEPRGLSCADVSTSCSFGKSKEYIVVAGVSYKVEYFTIRLKKKTRKKNK